MDIVSFVLSVQVFTVIFNILLNYYGNKILLNYDYDDPDMKEIIYKENGCGRSKNRYNGDFCSYG